MGRDVGVNAASYVKTGCKAHETWLGGTTQVIQDLIGYGLMECAMITKGPNIGLECLEFQAQIIRYIFKFQHRKVGLTGHWTQARKLRDLDSNRVIALRIGIIERFQRKGWGFLNVWIYFQAHSINPDLNRPVDVLVMFLLYTRVRG